MARAEDRPYRPDVSERRMSEDLEFRLSENSPSIKYARTASGPISVVPIARDLPDGRVQTVGYLWSSNGENAAGYVARRDAAPDSFNVGGVWRQRLMEAKSRGLSPEEAVLSCVSCAADSVFGYANSSDVRPETTLADLKALADSDSQ